jgi:hypothetical protein
MRFVLQRVKERSMFVLFIYSRRKMTYSCENNCFWNISKESNGRFGEKLLMVMQFLR